MHIGLEHVRLGDNHRPPGRLERHLIRGHVPGSKQQLYLLPERPGCFLGQERIDCRIALLQQLCRVRSAGCKLSDETLSNNGQNGAGARS